jgi:hypothetical protein
VGRMLVARFNAATWMVTGQTAVPGFLFPAVTRGSKATRRLVGREALSRVTRAMTSRAVREARMGLSQGRAVEAPVWYEALDAGVPTPRGLGASSATLAHHHESHRRQQVADPRGVHARVSSLADGYVIGTPCRVS